MSKQKIFLIILISLLILGSGIAGYIYFKNKRNVSNNNAPVNIEEAIENFKKIICANPEVAVDVNTINEKIKNLGISVHDVFVEDLPDIREYYFCSGLVNNNAEEACDNKLRDDAGLVDQCKNGFYFSEMLVAILNGDKEKAQEFCKKNNLGDESLCNSVGSFEEMKENDICSKLPENAKPFCLAIFNGDDSLCKGSENEAGCFAAAKFSSILKQKNAEKCDIRDSGIVSSGTKGQWITQGGLRSFR